MIKIDRPISSIVTSINLGGSKSLSNRLLLINHVFDLNAEFKNLSDAQDTELLKRALDQIKNRENGLIDIHHAGTDLRFLTALLAISPGEWVLTGSERLKQRPVGILVDALLDLGASIEYIEKSGFPPLKIKGQKIKGGKIQMNGSISSQFVSALLLISPCFENGLTIELVNNVVSQPYINMTVALLREQNVEIDQTPNKIVVRPYKIIKKNKNLEPITIESDWSSASYWYSICALSPGAQIELNFLKEASLQADAILPKLYNQLGVETLYTEQGILLKNKRNTTKTFSHDFTDCPDIAQTIAITCFGLGIEAQLSGLKTLKIKETDRIIALRNELEKFGGVVTVGDDKLLIKASELQSNSAKYKSLFKDARIETYNDHRMALSFAPLALLFGHINILNPEVVDKSYPKFWEDLKTAGFTVTSLT
jgi:3-phosphoshikimate 1-carboxyvinyltransferase